MIKRIFFDLDDTLFCTKNDAKKAYEKFLTKYDFNCTFNQLYDALDDINYMDTCTFEDYYLFLKKFLGENFTKDLFHEFNEIYINEVTLISDKTIEVLEYLKSKYELIVLSNWFFDLQNGKLKKLGLYNYFDKIYTLDTLGRKPNLSVLKKACEPYNFSECAMIGDTLTSDIVVQKKLGMKTYFLGESSEVDCISDIYDLLEIL